MSIPAQYQDPEPDPAFRQRSSEVFNQWQAGDLSFPDAVAVFNTMIQQAREQENALHEGIIEVLLGVMNGYRANYGAAIRHFEAAHTLYSSIQARKKLTTTTLNLGETYRLSGNFTRARTYFHQAAELSRELGDIEGQCLAQANEAQMWISLDSMEKAGTALETSLELANRSWPAENGGPEDEETLIQRLDMRCEILHGLVAVALHRNNPQQAWDYARRAYEDAQQLGYPLRLGFAHRALGDALTILGHSPDEAIDADPDTHYAAALEAFREVKAEGEVAKTLFAQGRSMARRGKSRSATRLFQQAMVLFTKLGMSDDAAKAAEAQLSLL